MSGEALTQFENKADQQFAALSLPHPNLHLSTWYLLTATEDAQRIWFTGTGNPDDAVVEYLIDKLKFSLRSCLALIARKASDRSSIALPNKLNGDLYSRARDMVFAGVDYAVVMQICGSVHARAAQLELAGDVYDVTVDERLIDARYSAFELMRQTASREPDIPISALLWLWMRSRERRPDVIHAVAATVRLKSRHVVYEMTPDLALWLAQSVPQRPLIIPQGWSFPWGGLEDTRLLLNAFGLRVLYHICAVHFGAVDRGLRGGAEGDLVLCQSEDDWVLDIRKNSSLDPGQIRTFVRYLTYGVRVTSPDQALQPFVPLGRNLLGVPGLAVMSSNLDRNLLTLQARVDPPSFNNQSGLFEKRMTSYLETAFRAKWSHVVPNRTLSLDSGSEEVDLLVCEPETRTVLVLELRWILPPADPREVQSKKVACHAKVPQARRKRDAVRRGLAQVLESAFGISTQRPESWRVEGAVVIEGFGGAPSPDPAVPIIPEWVLEAGVRRARNLRALADWMLSRAWLPVDGRDYQFIHEPRSLLGLQVRYAAISPIRSGPQFLEDATSALDARRGDVASQH
jgi:hypothetical protein